MMGRMNPHNIRRGGRSSLLIRIASLLAILLAVTWTVSFFYFIKLNQLEAVSDVNGAGNPLLERHEAVAAANRQSNDTNDNIRINNTVCKCVNCKEDKLCGGLWKAVKYEGEFDDIDIKKLNIHIVVSHCENDLSWISDFIQGFNVVSLHVMSKCGNTVKGAPPLAKVVTLPNVGRCDHSFVKYITTYLDGVLPLNGHYEDSVVVFLKEDMSDWNQHQHGKWNAFLSMIRVASSSNGFSCGITHGIVAGYDMSPYHKTKTLLTFSRKDYESIHHNYNFDDVRFKSNFSSLGEFYKYITKGELSELPGITQVCYGGVFAAKVSNIKRVKMAIWQSAENALTRGNNIEEGHFMERLWAVLLSRRLKSHEIDALMLYSDPIPPPQRFRRSHWGCLLRYVRN